MVNVKRLLAVLMVLSGLLAAGGASGSVTYNMQWSGAGATPSNNAVASGTVTFSTDPFTSATSCFNTLVNCNITALTITVSGASTGNGSYTSSDYSTAIISILGALNTSTNLVTQSNFSNLNFYSNSSAAPSANGAKAIQTSNATGDFLIMTSMALAPTVSSVSPTSGTTAGGTAIAITGTGFLSGATATVGGITCSSLTVVSSTSITCTTGAHAAGAVNVAVTNTNSQTGTGTNAYTYTNPAPTVSSVSPLTGTTAGSTAITITGTGFLSGATATVGGVACSSPIVVSSTSITCTTGAHAAGAVNVVVTNTDTQTGTGTNVYTYQSSNESGTTPGGNVSAAVSGGTFVAGTAQFTTPISPPSGQSFPYGVFGFTASTTSGGTITVTLTYPQALAAGTKVWKDLNGTWLDWTSNVTISGNTITYTITDGGAGDSDGAVNGSITDPLGPATTSTAVPTLSEWSQMLLALMVMTVIGWHFHRERSY